MLQDTLASVNTKNYFGFLWKCSSPYLLPSTLKFMICYEFQISNIDTVPFLWIFPLYKFTSTSDIWYFFPPLDIGCNSVCLVSGCAAHKSLSTALNPAQAFGTPHTSSQSNLLGSYSSQRADWWLSRFTINFIKSMMSVSLLNWVVMMARLLKPHIFPEHWLYIHEHRCKTPKPHNYKTNKSSNVKIYIVTKMPLFQESRLV